MIQKSWNLYFPGYLILDGWGHIQVGQKRNVSGLSLSPTNTLVKSNERRKSAVEMGFGYLVTAELVFKSREVCAIDFGVVAAGISDFVPEEAKTGDYLLGEIYVGIEREVAGPPEFEVKIPRCTWRVEKIMADMTPFIPHLTETRQRIRDESRTRYEEVHSTADAARWNADGSSGYEDIVRNFYLTCRLEA